MGCIIAMDKMISGAPSPNPDNSSSVKASMSCPDSCTIASYPSKRTKPLDRSSVQAISPHYTHPLTTTYPTTILPLTLPYPLPLPFPFPTPLPLLCSPFLQLSIRLTCSPTLCLRPGNFSIHLTSLPSPLPIPLLFPGNFSIQRGRGG